MILKMKQVKHEKAWNSLKWIYSNVFDMVFAWNIHMPLYLKCHKKDENILGSKDFVI